MRVTEENYNSLLEEMLAEFNAQLDAMTYDELVETFQPVFEYERTATPLRAATPVWSQKADCFVTPGKLDGPLPFDLALNAAPCGCTSQTAGAETRLQRAYNWAA